MKLQLRGSRFLQCVAPLVVGNSAVQYLLCLDPALEQHSSSLSSLRLLKKASTIQVGAAML